MKKIVLPFLIFGLLFLTGCGTPKVNKTKKIAKNGIVKKYDSHRRLTEETSYKNGKKEGISKFWQRMGYGMVNYTNGKKNGLETIYWSDGKLSSRRMYINGKLDGEARDWWQNGNLLSIGTYKNGKLIGKEKTYPAYTKNTRKSSHRNKIYDEMTALEMKLWKCRENASKTGKNLEFELQQCNRIEQQIKDMSAIAGRLGY